MNVEDLYNKLDKIFVDYTTHKWKNGWQHGDDKLSFGSNGKRTDWINLFLLQKSENYSGTEISIDGPSGFKIEVKKESDNCIRIDIESKQMFDIDIYYYVNNELDWLDNQDFIVDVCQKVYDHSVKLREAISNFPSDVYGQNNPSFVKKFARERKLNDLGI